MLEQVQQAYEEIRAYFSHPHAVLARGPSGCQYRTALRAKCAIGARLPDEWIDARGRAIVNACGSIGGLYDAFPEVEQFIGPKGSPLYQFHSDAQAYHDTCANVDDFIDSLDQLALECGLTLVTEAAPVETRVLVTA